MRKFLSSVSLFLAITLSILLALVGFAFSIREAAVYENYGIELVKQGLLRDRVGNRLVFVGGSNLAEGIDSPLIESNLNMPVVNMGFHAGLGLNYQLLAVTPYLRKGDVVVISPEYSNFRNDDRYLGEKVLLQLYADVLPCGIRGMPLKSAWHLLVALPEYVIHKWYRYFIPKKVSHPFAFENDYNEHGDYLPNRKNRHEFTYTAGKGLRETDVGTGVFDCLSEFKNLMTERGVKILLLPPAQFEGAFKPNKAYVAVLSEKLMAIKMPFIADPNRYVFPADMMYDTEYHLNAQGVRMRTRKVIEDIRVGLGVAEVTGLKGVY